MTGQENADGSALLSLPSSSDASAVDGASTQSTRMVVNSKAIQLDSLGPMVLNSDGTISRVTNWQEMTDDEKARTLRVLVARNRVRVAELQEFGMT